MDRWKKFVIVASPPLPIAVLVNAVRISIVGILQDWFGINVLSEAAHETVACLSMPVAVLLLWLEATLLNRVKRTAALTYAGQRAPRATSARRPLPANRRRRCTVGGQAWRGGCGERHARRAFRRGGNVPPERTRNGEDAEPRFGGDSRSLGGLAVVAPGPAANLPPRPPEAVVAVNRTYRLDSRHQASYGTGSVSHAGRPSFIHVPEDCYPAAGYRILQTESSRSRSATDATVPARLLSVETRRGAKLRALLVSAGRGNRHRPSGAMAKLRGPAPPTGSASPGQSHGATLRRDGAEAHDLLRSIAVPLAEWTRTVH